MIGGVTSQFYNSSHFKGGYPEVWTGGYPSQVWMRRGYPIPGPGGYPIQLTGGTLSQVQAGGYPIPGPGRRGIPRYPPPQPGLDGVPSGQD